MSVTQDYKVLTLTASESDAVRLGLAARRCNLQAQIDFLEPMGTHTARVGELRKELADVQSAFAKVRA